MKSHRTPALILLTVCFLAFLNATAQVHVTRIQTGADAVVLDWEGGNGPFIVETSRDLQTWTDVGEPAPGSSRSITALDTGAFYRIADVDPAGLYGSLFGLIQTYQGEFGSLMARHRLKSRLWLYKSKGAPHNSVSYTPAGYWRKLFINLQHLEDGQVRTWAGVLEDLGIVATPSAQSLTVTWTSGQGPDRRRFLLTLDFPYGVNASRTAPPFPSDPTYSLQCTYDTPQPELDFGSNSFKSTRVDTVGLTQMDPLNNPTGPDPWSFRMRKYVVSRNGVEVALEHLDGLPLVQGKPPFILKTLPLDRWMAATTGKGGSLPAFSTDSYFARTLLPGHHNFYDFVLLEPALDPAVPEHTRAALVQANIRQVYTFKDLAGVTIGGDSEDIHFIGFDNVFRRP